MSRELFIKLMASPNSDEGGRRSADVADAKKSEISLRDEKERTNHTCAHKKRTFEQHGGPRRRRVKRSGMHICAAKKKKRGRACVIRSSRFAFVAQADDYCA